MSKLREKFKTQVSINTTGESERFAKQCEQITDDFAIKFAMHISTHCNCELGNDTRSYKQLLQIFKENHYE